MSLSDILVYVLFHTVAIYSVSEGFNRLNLVTSVDQYMNLCLDGKYHKDRPTVETGLNKSVCKSWSSLSCCSSLNFDDASSTSLYRFTHSHCGNMSETCQQVFRNDLCFYQCSPNLGPWLVKVTRKISSERMYHVPLCQSECNYWWDSCKNDSTCVTNWHTHFNWSTGTNVCPQSSSCSTIQSIFKDAKTFCESIWDDGFKVVPDNENSGCMVFNERSGVSIVENNRMVAQRRAREIIGLLNGTCRSSIMNTLLLLPLLFVMIGHL
ncbi:unnamed protein product [Trichobilharzia szidati]|nr:unnamed protein product [Trichobilharzia szidati]